MSSRNKRRGTPLAGPRIEMLESRQLMSIVTSLTDELFARAALAAAAAVTATQPSVSGSSPTGGATNVRRDAFVSANVSLPNGAVDPATVSTSTVKLYRTSDGLAISGTANTSGGGDILVFQPSTLLNGNTNYTFEVTSGVRDITGAAFQPYKITFTTGTAGGPVPSNVEFEQVSLSGTSGNMYTSVAVGPDRKLYAGTLDGRIIRFAINPDGTLGAGQSIQTIKSEANSNRLVTGFVFDPGSTATDLNLWVVHGDFNFDNALEWSGKITRLRGANLEIAEDAVINLPRAAHDHLTNQPVFGPDGALYFAQGGNTAHGAIDSTWGLRPERLLTAAVLRLDVSRISPGTPLDVKTEETATPYNPFAPGAPLTVYATGLRNAYDITWTSDGRLYAPNNGSNPGGATPATPALPDPNSYRIDGDDDNDPSNGMYSGPAVPGINPVDEGQNDYLYHIAQGGYYGHPNPSRWEFVHNGGNPTSGVDPQELSVYPVGVQPDRNFRPAAFDFGKNRSPNGIIEYHGNAFDGALKGKLLVVRYSGGDDVIVLTRNADGSISQGQTGIPGLTGFSDPLDLIEDPVSGYIYVAQHGGKQITLLRPVDLTQPPQVPLKLTAQVASSSQINLIWNKTAGAQLYRIQRKGPNDSTFVDYDTTTTPGYNDGGLIANSTYSYRVRAENIAGVSAYAAAVTATTPAPGAYIGLEIGATQGGSSTVLSEPGAFDVVGGGPTIFDSADGFHFLYKQRTGDFDVKVRVDSLTASSPSARAGLMVRESLTAESRNVYSFATASAGYRFSYRAATAGSTTRVEKGVVSYPNAWVRIQRVGNLFTGYYSTDGQTWVQTGQVQMTLGSAVFFGMAVSSNTTAETATARFRDFGEIAGTAWRPGVPLPAHMAELGGAVIGGKMYVAGEGNASTLAFDFATQTWTPLGTLATRPFVGDNDAAEHATETVGGKLYLIGGLTGGSENKVQIYDPNLNTWTLGANRPWNAGSSLSAVINGEIYVAAGAINSPYGPVARVGKYNPATNTWTELAPMPLPRHSAAGGTDGQKLYIFGGRDKGLEISDGTDTVSIYDPATNTWTSSEDPGSGIPRMPRKARGVGIKAVFYNGEFYIFGGENSSGDGATPDKVLNRVDIYNPTTKSWRIGPPMTTARHATVPVLHDGKVYLVGGGIKAGTSFSNIVEVLDLNFEFTPTAPTAPTGLTATATSARRVELRWTDTSFSETHFDVLRSTDGVNFSLVAQAGVNATTFLDVTAEPDTLYYYRVRAGNSVGNSPISNTAQVTTPIPAPPAAPTSLAGSSLTPSRIDLTWADNATDETGYVVLRSTDGTNFAPVANLAANAKAYSDVSVAAGTTYHYRVQAVNDIGGAVSNTATIASRPLAPLAAPTGLTGSVISPTRIDLSWADNATNEEEYVIQRSTDGVTFAPIGEVAFNVTSYVDDAVAPATRYYYRVVASNAGGASTASNTLDISTPQAPTFTSEDINTPLSGSTTVVSDGAAYDVTAGGADIWGTSDSFRYLYQQRSGDFDLRVQVPALSLVTNATKAGLMVRETLAANSRNVFSGVTAGSGFRFGSRGATGGKTINAFAGGTTAFPYVWVRLQRVGDVFTGYQSTDGNHWTKTASVTMVLPSTVFFGMAVASNSTNLKTSGQFRHLGASSEVVPEMPPAPPTGLTAAATSFERVSLSWADNAQNETGYTVLRSTNGVDFAPIAQLEANARQYADTTVAADTRYYYQVRAFNTAGTSPVSNTADATTPIPTPPLAPTGLAAHAATPNRVELTWVDNAADETGYLVLRSEGGAQEVLVASLGEGAESYADTTVQPGRSYAYRVQAVNAIGSTSTGPVSVATPALQPIAAPGGVAAAATHNSVSLSWVDNSNNEEGFTILRSTNGVDFVAVGQVGVNVSAYVDTTVASETQYTYRIVGFNGGGTSDAGEVDVVTLKTPSFSSVDVNATPVGNTVHVVDKEAYDVSGGGLDIWGNSDSFRYVYEQRTGDFDVRAHIPAFAAGAATAKAGLMARESLDANSRNVFSGVSAGEGYRFMHRSSTGGKTFMVFNGGAPVFPDVWVRLKRVGGTFTSYYSADGITWAIAGSVKVTMPTTVYFGMAVASKSATATAQVQFRNLSDVPPLAPLAASGVTATPASAHDALVKWNPADGAVSYRVERQGPGETGFVAVGTATTTRFLDSGLAPGATYTYRVIGINAIGESPASAAVSVTLPAAGTLVGTDVGAPARPGSSVAVVPGESYDVTGGGRDIWGTADEFHFVNRQVTGEFDVRVRVESLDGVDPWSKAGLMVRESLAANSRNAMISATPSTNGTRFTYRQATGGTTHGVGSGAVSYPNMWLRLTRVGDVITGYTSTDGMNWIMTGSVTMALPETVYIGMAVTGHSSSTTATAAFRDFEVL